MLKGKHIILGITGSIAAYKAALYYPCIGKERCRGTGCNNTRRERIYYTDNTLCLK